MVKTAALLLVVTLTACGPAPEKRLRAIDIEIAQAQQEIRNIEADAIRRQADHAATAHQFADQPDVLVPILTSMAATDRQMAAVNDELIAGYRRSIEVLEARRRAIEPP